MNITYQKGFKFGAAVTSLGMYYTSNKICPRIPCRREKDTLTLPLEIAGSVLRSLPAA